MTRQITYQGKTQSISAWSRDLGIPGSTIRSRLDTLGMTIEEALSRRQDERFQPRPRPAPRIRPAPKLKRDSRGRGYVRWSSCGRRITRILGPWDDPETTRAYSRFAAEWYSAGGHGPASAGQAISVASVAGRAFDWAERTYRKHGKPTSEVAGFRSALASVNDLYGDLPAEDFGPVQLRAVRDSWVARGLSLKTCNDYLNKVIRAWRFAVGQGLIPAALAEALRHVENLAPGRTSAVIHAPVPGADDRALELVIPRLDRLPDRQAVLSSVVRLLRATGMRPGEVLELRPEDIDRSREPWLYRPPSGGKTFHLEKDRKVFLGPLAREILRPWLAQAEAGQLVFRFARKRGAGHVPVRIEYLRDRLAEACTAVGVDVIRPNQLRHAKATEVQRAYEDDAAVAAALGNTPEVARQVYVDSPADAVARRIAEALG